MRSFFLLLLTVFWASLTQANDVNISTVTHKGATLFYLQAGAFGLEKDALQRAQGLKAQTKEPISIKKLADKSLFLVQIGPLEDYPSARALQDRLSVKTESIISPLPRVFSRPKLKKKRLPQSQLWNLRNADIRAVIAEVSRVTGKNFIIDPRVQGKISIVSTTAMSNSELYHVFESVLQVSGYAAIPNGAIIKIVPNIDAKTSSTDPKNPTAPPPQGDDMMVSVVPVHYVPAEQLVPALRPLMPQWSSISAYAPSNMLIFSGRASNIQSLTRIIQEVDNSSASDIDLVHLRHGLAMDITGTLKELIKTQGNSNNHSSINISTDDRSNSILVSGNKTDRIRLRMLILKLDREGAESNNSNTQVVYLNYLRAEDLVPILAGIAQANFSGTVGTTIGSITRPPLDSTNPASNVVSATASGASSGPGANGNPNPATPNAETPNTTAVTTQNEGSTKPSIQIIAEPNTNSIILNAPASINRVLKKVIQQLDIKPAQLLIEAMVAEVNQTSINDLGIEWGTKQQTGLNTNFRPGFAIINSKTSSSDFQAQIYALATEHKANILSTPSVVVLDNRQAKILVGKQVSIASTSYPNNAGGTTTASPYTTFDRVNVALHLYVRPQITRGQGIQMQIDQGNDTLDPLSQVAQTTYPTFSISSIVTSVHVESGDVVVLGGLNQDSLANNNERIPILGDIPGIGRLFQRNIRNRDKKVLMVFIKPIILRNPKDDLYVSGEKYNTTRQYELDWVRSQEVFNQTNNETVLPQIHDPMLPMPFSRPQQHIQATQ